MAIVKTIVHIKLDVKNGYKIDFSGMKAFEYVLPYDKQVSQEDEKLKRVCNILNRMLIVCLVVFVIAITMRYFLK